MKDGLRNLMKQTLRASLALAAAGAGLSPLAQAASPAELARAEEIVMGKCFICHGAEGESSSPVFPRLAGQHAQYTENQLKAFNKRDRTNDNAVMHTVASKLTELEIKAVASYISGLE